MLKKILLISLFLVPLKISAMSTLDMCDRVADIWCEQGELQLVRDYKKKPAMRSAIKKSIQEDIASQVDKRAQEKRLDFWLELAKEQRAVLLVQHMRTMGALDDRDGSKRAASGRRNERKEKRERKEVAAQADAQQKSACVLM
jgi:hypothetical protein